MVTLCQILLLGGQLGLPKHFCALAQSARTWPQHKIRTLGLPAQCVKLHNSVKLSIKAGGIFI